MKLMNAIVIISFHSTLLLICCIAAESRLFRGNSLTVIMFQVFAKIYGVRYLWDTLGVFLLELNEITSASQQDVEEAGAFSLLTETIDLEVIGAVDSSLCINFN